MSVTHNSLVNPTQRAALLVLGMHRSGTSAVARTLSLMGADLPLNLYAGRPEGNPTGYWESADWIELHDELLAAHGLNGNSPLPLPAGALAPEALASFRARLVAILRRDFADSVLFVAKDPRMCRLLPLWHAALAQAGFVPCHIILVRHPLEVAASLAVRDQTPEATVLLSWMRHLLEAEWASRGKPRIFVSYDDLLDDWREVIDRISAEFRVDWPVAPAVAQVAIETFLNRNLRHHHFEGSPTFCRYKWVKDAYEAALDCINNEPRGIKQFDRLRRELAAGDELFGPMMTEYRGRDQELWQFAAEIGRLTEANRLRDNELTRHRETVARVQAEAATLWDHVKSRDTEIGHLNIESERSRGIVATMIERYAHKESEIVHLGEELAAREREMARLCGEFAAREREFALLRGEANRLPKRLVALIEQYKNYCLARQSLPEQLRKRIPYVVGMLLRGDYYRFSHGFSSAFRDLRRSVRKLPESKHASN